MKLYPQSFRSDCRKYEIDENPNGDGWDIFYYEAPRIAGPVCLGTFPTFSGAKSVVVAYHAAKNAKMPMVGLRRKK